MKMLQDRGSTPARGPEYRGIGKFLPALRATAVIALAFAAPSLAYADNNALTVSDGWMRMIIPSRPAAGYFTLQNDGTTERALTGASSPACGNIMLHRSVTADGAEKMEMVPKVAVPAHGNLQFAPHGYHLMCMQPTAAMKPGEEVPVTLHFEDGSSITSSFKVKGATGE